MKKIIILLGFVLCLSLSGFAQSNGNGGGNGNGNGGANGAAGQEIPQPIVSQIAHLASPLLNVTQGAIIHAYHILECQIICIDPINKAYRVTMNGDIAIVLLGDF